MEKVGVCHHMGRVSPVFDVANNLLIFEVENGHFREVDEKMLMRTSAFNRAKEVSAHGVHTVLCGAVSRPLQQALQALGIKVLGFLCGSITEIMGAFAEDRIRDERFLMPGCCAQALSFTDHELRAGVEHAPKRGPLKIAVASIDGMMEGMVDERFGRCRKLVVYTPQSDTFEVIDNESSAGSAQGAGVQTAHDVVNAGVYAVISGDFGPKAFQVLRSGGVEVYSTTKMTVREALSRFQNGQLNKLSIPAPQSP